MTQPPEQELEIISQKNLDPGVKEGESAEITGADIDYGRAWKDIKNFRSLFNAKDFFFNLCFGLSPSAWDIVTDFNFAEKLKMYRREGKGRYFNGPLFEIMLYDVEIRKKF